MHRPGRSGEFARGCLGGETEARGIGPRKVLSSTKKLLSSANTGAAGAARTSGNGLANPGNARYLKGEGPSARRVEARREAPESAGLWTIASDSESYHAQIRTGEPRFPPSPHSYNYLNKLPFSPFRRRPGGDIAPRPPDIGPGRDPGHENAALGGPGAALDSLGSWFPGSRRRDRAAAARRAVPDPVPRSVARSSRGSPRVASCRPGRGGATDSNRGAVPRRQTELPMAPIGKTYRRPPPRRRGPARLVPPCRAPLISGPEPKTKMPPGATSMPGRHLPAGQRDPRHVFG